MNNDFPRIKRLPPYVFNITNELKMAARHRGEDIIDLSMGNPDGDTPKHIGTTPHSAFPHFLSYCFHLLAR